MDVGLVDALCDYSRPVFLFGERPRPVAAHPPARDLPFEPSAPDRPICLSIPSDADRGTSPRTHASADRVNASTSDSTDTGLTPPLEGATQDELKETARKFVERSATLATDGFIVYDIQEEKGRTPEPRPFPFRKLDDPSHFAKVLKDVSGKESVVYKCVAESDPGGFDGWLNKAIDDYGVNAYNLVGGASSANQYSGPTIPDVAAKLNKRKQCAHGGVTIAERHIKKGNEHETLVKKGELGMQWFISQAIYDPEPMIKLLKEYGALCRQRNIEPKRVVLTFAPCGREKTMRFIKWLGVTVPEDIEREILDAEDKVGKSVDLLCAMCKKILDETKGCGVPLGISVESVSIFKNEINAAHELFRRTQSMLLDFLGEPWLVQYKLVSKGVKRTSFDYGSRKSPASPGAALPPVKEPKVAKKEGGNGGLFEGLSEEEQKKLGIAGAVGVVVGFILGAVLGGGKSKPVAPAPEPPKKKGWGK